MLQGLLARVRVLLADFAAGSAMIAERLRIAAWPSAFGAAVLWLGAKLLSFWLMVARWILGFLHAIAVPKNDAPADILKHYGSVFGVLIGFGALVWTVLQILYPPLVITVNKLPAQLESENWLNSELSRTLLAQLERMRAVVKGERDPAFEAVLNPPNIVVKTGDWSLNVQEQILTPLGTLLGRGQGEVHLAVTCYQPNCARTSDPECRDPIKKDDPKAPERQYLCLRLTADIYRGKLHRRLTPRLTLTNDTYEVDLARQMSRVAEAVTSTADPTTAALYFYRRVRQEGEAARSITNDLDVIAELRGEAFKAAEQSEKQDTVAKCWAHSVRAHLAIDRREFSLAEGYLSRARNLSWWDHLSHFTLKSDCERLIALAEMEFARQLARSAAYPAYPPHPEDNDGKRVSAAHSRIGRLLDHNAVAWAGFIRNRIDRADLRGALEMARAEIGLAWFTQADQCRLLDGHPGPVEFEPDPMSGESRETAYQDGVDDSLRQIRFAVWPTIKETVDKLQALTAERPLPPLTRQAAMDFLELFAFNEVCTDNVQAIAHQVYLAHPSDAKVTQTFAAMTEAAAMRKSRNLQQPAAAKDRGNLMLGYAKSLYERLVDIGDDKADIIALNRLAFITEAFYADGGDTFPRRIGPIPETLSTVLRAWRRYQQQYYPSDTRHHAEFLVSFWGSLLLRFYPDFAGEDLTTDAVSESVKNKEQLKKARTNFADFQRALRVLFPSAQAARLADLSALDGIGTRISCLCMLSHVVYQNELADFLIARIHKWQDVKANMSKCRDDLIPAREKATFEATRDAYSDAELKYDGPAAELDVFAQFETSLEKARSDHAEKVEDAARKLESAQSALEKADPKTPDMEKAIADALKALAEAKAEAKSVIGGMEAVLEEAKPRLPELTRARDEAREVLDKARDAAFSPRMNMERKEHELKSAAAACHFKG